MMILSRSMFAGVVLLLTSVAPLKPQGLHPASIPGTQFAPAALENTLSDTGGSSLTPLNRMVDNGGPHSPEGDARLAAADSHFNLGRQAYFRGDYGTAKREFDLSVDTLLSGPEGLPDSGRIERRLDEICELVYRFDAEKLGAGEQKQVEEAAFDKAPIDEIGHMTFPVDPKLASRLTSELNQTTSAIPLELADPVLSYVHFFQTERGRSILLAGFRRSGRYKPLIERIFSEEGVPQELIYLAQAESGFLPRAVSYKNAVGMWQFIAGTGSMYQLERTSDFDERLDPEKATRAAAKYLKDLYARYGDWYLAMAAYNCGAGAVDRAVERTGYADYWELLKRHALPKETSGYVPIILAMTIIAKNPTDYGLTEIDVDPELTFDTLHLTASTNLNLLADVAMQPISVIRDLNPSLLRGKAPVGFDVHLPKGSLESVQAALETIPEANREAWRLHHVVTGDTLEAIARSYHVKPERIAAVNRASDSIEAGDVLLIPAVYREDKPLASGKRSSTRVRNASNVRRAPTASHSTHIAASRRVSPQVLRRRASVRTASIERP
jgi:membrane-bound lytic murein transglycosylase D